MDEKILNITHADLDGLGAYKVLEEVFGRSKVDVLFAGYPFNEATLKKIQSYTNNNKYNAVFITDISFKTEDREFIENMKLLFPPNIPFTYIDHHESSDPKLADLFSDFNLDKSGNYAGCGLTYFLFKDYMDLTPTKRAEVELFNKIADSYDLWKLDEYWEKGLELQEMLEFFPFNDLKNWTYKMLSNPDSDFVLRSLKKSLAGKKKYALSQTELNKFTKEINLNGEKYTVGLFYNPNFRNYICHNLNVDVAICGNPTSLGLSFRSKRNNIHVHKFCEQFKGGGHELAAACRVDRELFFNHEELLTQFVNFIEGK